MAEITSRDHLLTETRLNESMQLDSLSIINAVDLMNRQDATVAAAVASQREPIARAVELVVNAFASGGRLFYVGAGTSGRLGVLDASECPPTFRSDPSMVQGIIAGGDVAMFLAKEGAEDRFEDGEKIITDRGVTSTDVVMGIAAGGTTPFVHGALHAARGIKARTIFLSCVQHFSGETPVDVVIRPLTGPEVLTGSTRLKAGTATKLVLNTISTVAMVTMGKCYENLMVDLKASNSKLRDRAARIVATLTGCSKESAEEAVSMAGGDVKAAVVMRRLGLDLKTALIRLEQNKGNLRQTLRQS